MDGVAIPLFSRILRALGLQRDIDALRQRVTTQERAAKADAAAWRETRHRLKASAVRMKSVAASLSRRMASPDIVQELLPQRLATLAARRSYADADRYDERLLQISTPYREAVTSAATGDELAAVDIQGVSWTVPVPSSLTGTTRERFVREQQFPYRTIAETREFAVGPVLIDIGANCGLMSIPRVVLGDVTRAYCAEPDPLNFAALVRNVVSNGLRGLVLPDQAAIGAVTGPMRLRRAKYPGGHRVVGDARPGDGTFEVPGFTLDDWCERLAIEPGLVTYIKVDVQGSEVAVLRGATRLLAHAHIAWQVEVNPQLLAAAGTTAQELCDLCAAHFTHFVDLDKLAQGPRARSTRELGAAIARLAGRARQTDIILFNAGARLDARMGRWAEKWGDPPVG